MGFLQWLDEVISHIRRKQADHETIGKTIRELPQTVDLSGEGALRRPMTKAGVQGKVGGVDSGFVSQSFYAMDLMLVRAMGVCFTYEQGKMVRAEYWPEHPGMPQPIVDTKGLEPDEFRRFVSLTRVRAEMDQARELIARCRPDVMFLDGSLILHPADKPGNESKLKEEYEIAIRSGVALYSAAEKANCLLIGAVEDSRSTRLSEMLRKQYPHHPILGKQLGKELQDAPLMDKVLHAGERSIAFRVAEDIMKHPILMDYPSEWGARMHASYIKPSPWDYPLRIEFFSGKEGLTAAADAAASQAFAQSSLHKEYAYPSVLIEADMRAGLKPEEVDLVSDKIFSKIGRHTIHLRRRDRRPF